MPTTLKLRGVYIDGSDVKSFPYENIDQIKDPPDYYGLYWEFPDGFQEHVCDIDPKDNPKEIVASAIEKASDISFVQGMVYALAERQRGSSVTEILESAGIKQEEFYYCDEYDLKQIIYDIQKLYPDYRIANE